MCKPPIVVLKSMHVFDTLQWNNLVLEATHAGTCIGCVCVCQNSDLLRVNVCPEP